MAAHRRHPLSAKKNVAEHVQVQAAFLKDKGNKEALKYDLPAKNKKGLNELAVLYLSKVLTKEQVRMGMLTSTEWDLLL